VSSGPDAIHTLGRGEVPQTGRRNVLNWLLGTWAAGVVGSILYPLVQYLVPPEVAEAPTLSVKAGPAATLQPNTGRLVPFGSAPALVVRTASGELKAFSATCTHLSCTVQYRSDLQHVWCACHNGHYDLNGRNIAGPPPRPLDEYQANVQDDEIVISRRG
jgi:Rieske Fe-S protein